MAFLLYGPNGVVDWEVYGARQIKNELGAGGCGVPELLWELAPMAVWAFQDGGGFQILSYLIYIKIKLKSSVFLCKCGVIIASVLWQLILSLKIQIINIPPLPQRNLFSP